MRRVRIRSVVPSMIVAPLGLGTLLLATTVFAQGAPPPLPGPGATAAPAPAPAPTAAPTPLPAAAPTPAPASGPPPAAATPPPAPAAGAAGATAGATVSMDGAGAGLDADADGEEDDDEETRERSLHETPTEGGPTGLLHTPSAVTREGGTFGVGLMLDWFKSSTFLCTADYPCGTNTSDKHSHIGAVAAISATFVTGLEGYLTGRVYANSNDQGRPNLLQVLGDTTLGLKYVRPLGSGFFNVGAGAEVLFLNGTGGVGLSGDGTSYRLRALTTFALDKTPAKTPLRFHLAFGYLFDNSGKLVTDVEDARGKRTGKREQITRVERYGLGINKVDRAELSVGIEGLLAKDKVRPFLEYNVWLPVNRQSYECPKPVNMPGGGRSDECLAEQGFSFFPSKLSVGVKAFPFEKALSGLSFIGAADIGLTGVNKFISEMAPQAPYTVWVGMALTTDGQEKAPRIVEKQVEKRVEVQVGTQLVHVRGFVHDAAGGAPIANAIVSYAGGAAMAPVASGGDGYFGDDVPAGQYQFTIKADGYKDGTCGGTAVAPPKPGDAAPVAAPMPGAPPGTPPKPMTPGTLEVDCAMEALPKVGNVSLSIVDADTQAPLSGIGVTVTDLNNSNPKSMTSDASGLVRLEGLTPGMFFVTVDADGYFATKASFEARVREDLKQTVSLRARPKDKLVDVTKTEIKIKQQVHFATDKAIILGDSTGLLEEVADAMIHTGRIHKIEVQGHTDNTGTKEHNLQLSIDRAEAVKKFLVDHGVEGDRLVTHGFGDTKPVAPNINDAGKAKNRRVQFVILEQDQPPAEDKKKPKKP